MTELMLFRQDADGRDVELSGSTVALEVELQRRVEAGLEQMLGIRFVASEYATGPWHRGRIDTLGLDENGSPVLIEFKKGSDSEVLSEAVSYLSWLRLAQHEFEALVRKVLGAEAAESTDWRRPRMVRIAAGSSHHDRVAAQWLPERTDLVRYRVFDGGLLPVDPSSGSPSAASSRRSRERDAVVGGAPTAPCDSFTCRYQPRAGVFAGPVRGAGRGPHGVGRGRGGITAALHRLPTAGDRGIGDLPSEARGDPGLSQTRPGLGRAGGGLHPGHARHRASRDRGPGGASRLYELATGAIIADAHLDGARVSALPVVGSGDETCLAVGRVSGDVTLIGLPGDSLGMTLDTTNAGDTAIRSLLGRESADGSLAFHCISAEPQEHRPRVLCELDEQPVTLSSDGPLQEVRIQHARTRPAVLPHRLPPRHVCGPG
ncbi:hypothetical protein GCM10010218_06420 [Streptomyces mashuensis]|uniref:DUF91 domain-containing protein n=1 Tax=Streptomyces mashuensis TaxID=33904 RepID=A0A919E9S0_9ACTN|nr:hypothetical protein [Streptomyces mashuensis]GHF28035.1 hypothetical protein GCM10010218_06420 [Streptomyces mashuensis]